MIVKPLYGHTSVATAYIVNNYPYSFHLRCRIAYWLDYNKTRGFRLVSQTTNPKKNDIWNTPKKSTYALFAGGLYLDEKDYVQWSGLTEYSDAKDFLEFFNSFPDLKFYKEQSRLIRFAVVGKIAICKATLSGKAVFTINNIPQMPTEQDIERASHNLKMWEDVSKLLENRWVTT